MFNFFIPLKNAVLAALKAFRAAWKATRATQKAAKAARAVERKQAKAAKAVRDAAAKELKAKQVEQAKAAKTKLAEQAKQARAEQAKQAKIERAQVQAIRIERARNRPRGGWLRNNFIVRAIGSVIRWFLYTDMQPRVTVVEGTVTEAAPKPAVKPHTSNGRPMASAGK